MILDNIVTVHKLTQKDVIPALKESIKIQEVQHTGKCFYLSHSYYRYWIMYVQILNLLNVNSLFFFFSFIIFANYYIDIYVLLTKKVSDAMQANMQTKNPPKHVNHVQLEKSLLTSVPNPLTTVFPAVTLIFPTKISQLASIRTA